MFKAATFLFLVLVLTGCKEVSYPEPQPKGRRALSSVPRKLQGRYVVRADSETDTLTITSSGYIIASDQESNEIGDSLVLKHYRGYYFVNVNDNPEWLLRIIHPEKNGDLTYMAMHVEGKSFDELLQHLSREIAIDSLTVGDKKLYQIDPTPRKLIDLIRKGYFADTLRLQRIR